MRVTEKREEVQRIDQEGVVAHQNRCRPLAVLAARRLRQPGGVVARVLERAGADGEGVYKGGRCVAEGLGFYPNRRKVRGDHAQVRRVCPELPRRDDRWGRPVSDRGEREDVTVRERRKTGRGLDSAAG
jgi:hypothetical protein